MLTEENLENGEIKKEIILEITTVNIFIICFS